MDNKKQKYLIELLISSADTFALCQNIIKAEYFDPEFRNTVTFIKQYYNDYDTTPLPVQIEAETDQILGTHDVAPDMIKHCAVEVEKFCKRGAMVKAILASVELVDKGEYGAAEALIKDAAMVSLTTDLGVDYFKTVDERLERMSVETQTAPTFWTGIDAALYGGISRKELLLVSANSGGGKSITLANLAINFASNGMVVLYLSLELSADTVAQRFDTMVTGISRKDWKGHIPEISKKVKDFAKNSSGLHIVHKPTGTTANEIRAYLKEFYLLHKVTPDLLVVDYLDNMAPNEFVSADNVFEKDKRSSEQLRQIGVDYNMFVATASQLNRSAINAPEHNHSQIAGGISKINVSDVYWSILMNEEMRAMGKIIFKLQKTRNSDGVGKQIHLKWDAKTLRILDDDDDDSTPLSLNPRSSDDDMIDDIPSGNGDRLTALLADFAE